MIKILKYNDFINESVKDIAMGMSYAIENSKDMMKALDNIEDYVESINTSIDKVLGAGGEGVAILLKNGKVLKVTKSKRGENEIVKKLIDNPMDGMAKYYSIEEKDNIYYIIMEKLTMLNDSEKEWFNKRKLSLVDSFLLNSKPKPIKYDGKLVDTPSLYDYESFINSILMYKDINSELAKDWLEWVYYEDLNDISDNSKREWEENKPSDEELDFWRSFTESNYEKMKKCFNDLKLASYELRGDNIGRNDKGDIVIFDALPK